MNLRDAIKFLPALSFPCTAMFPCKTDCQSFSCVPAKVSARVVAWGLSAILLSPLLFAQDDVDAYGPQPTGSSNAVARYAVALATYTNTPDVLVLPGLIAKRQERRIEVLSEYTGLKGGDTVEFLLIDQSSSHGYEALLWSFAKPSDIHRALMFIGLAPGAPIDPSALRFWADGDRVNLTVRDDKGDTVRIEELVLDRQTDATLPREGFVFAGSVLLPSREGKDTPLYAADIYDPRCVASLYNEPTAVLDVPRRLGKGEAYGNQVVNPAYGLTSGELLTIVMEPADPERQQRAHPLVLSVAPLPDVAVEGTAATNGMRPGSTLTLTLTDASGKTMNVDKTHVGLLECLVALRKTGGDPVLEVRLDDGLVIAQVRETSTLLALIENMLSIRIMAPEDGQLYYGAFLPQEAWRSPENRPRQPWELHLAQRSGSLAAKLYRYRETSTDNALPPTFERIEREAPNPEFVAAQLRADTDEPQDDAPAPSVLFVYVGPDLTYGQLMRFMAPVLSTRSVVYVFAETANDNTGHARKTEK
ncbi:MAG: YdjY domain-containing protein [Verrucomicrobia bacterium]|nr:YdjY domain-containing protein [Verrucomicrobiota bacterium]